MAEPTHVDHREFDPRKGKPEEERWFDEGFYSRWLGPGCAEPAPTNPKLLLRYRQGEQAAEEWIKEEGGSLWVKR